MKTILVTTIITFLMINRIPAQTMMDHYPDKDQPDKQVKLSKKITEISGLAVSGDGRIFAHDDELAVIYQLNSDNGNIVKQFFLGKKKPLKGDFEGLAIAGSDFYLTTSAGTIYQFTEGEDDQSVSYRTYKTSLSEKYDVEGLCFDPETGCLLLACKRFAGKNKDGQRSVYSFSLKHMELEKEPRFTIEISAIMKYMERSISKKLGEFFLLIEPAGFAPSGIERHPVSGTFFILSSQSALIAEVDKAGKVIAVKDLDSRKHRQPEGIVFLPDNTMLISDEGVDQKATLSFYSYKNDF